jgi:hypothetical protein
MSITYTSRKGFTYTLCQSVTKTGKPRYTFVRDPKDRQVVEEMPDGYEISESVNGIVSLVKERPKKLLPEEIAAVEDAVRRHSRARNYRVNVKPDRIEIYESIGPDAEDLIESLSSHGFGVPGLGERIRAERERYTQFRAVLRFILEDEETRDFRAERWCYLGSIDDWIFVTTGPLEQMARQMIPKLGSDAFFELY